jgi:sn-glycerol 3-phosphate transport system permease protein
VTDTGPTLGGTLVGGRSIEPDVDDAGDDAAPRRRLRRDPELPRYTWKEAGLAALFLAPSLAVFVVFAYVPFVRIIGWGTYESRANGTRYESVGLDQYKEVLTGSDFWNGVWHSLQFVIVTVPAGILLGTVLAVVANRRLKGIKVFQTIFASTIASSVAVTSVIFFYLINPVVGWFKVDWLGNPSTAMWAVALPSVWQNLGLSFVIVLAGLQAVPDEVLEAATLDGYGPVRRFVRIIVPLISPVLMFLAVVLVVFGFQAYAQVDFLTSGGPAGSTETLVFKIFQKNTPDTITVGSVMSVGLFVLTFFVTLLQFVILDRRVHYGR